MKMIKGIKEINGFLNNWLKDNDFDLIVKYSNDFYFDEINDIVSYTFTVPGKHDEYFIEFCKNITPEIVNCDNFILSFFHEIGHYETQDLFTEKEWEEYIKAVNKLNRRIIHSKKEYFKYFNLKIEFEASYWACNYIVENKDKIKKFWEELQPLILSFYILNNVENS